MTKIILSTTNPSKAEQIKAMFIDLSVDILTLSEAGIEGEALEDGISLGENAVKKVQYVKEKIGEQVWVMADDTGLFITALNGRPGIHAARWAGDVSTDEITQYTLDQLKGANDRSALFKTVVCLLSPDGRMFQFEGEVYGHLSETAKTPAQPKMPYSPLFTPEGYAKVWGEMTTEEENAVSHRGKAFRKVVSFLKEELK